jgi:hypothetical protein
MLAGALAEAGLPYFLLRRRSSPRDEPRVRAWLTWLALAHPEWDASPQPYDVAEALHLSLTGLDPVRASLVAQHLYPPGSRELRPVDALSPPIAGRIGAAHAARIEELRAWLEEHGHDRHPPDVFLNRLFNELLGQPRFQPEPDVVGAAICDWLVRTATRLRQAANPLGLALPADIGETLLSGVYRGLVTAGPPEMGEPPAADGILITTIYGYLLAGRPVRLQVWLEAAASGWWDIPRQPLSNAFVLAQSRPADRLWTMAEEYAVRNELLSRIVRGLTHRCSGGIILANSDLDRRGMRQDGPLWRALQPARMALAARQPEAA